ncbi:MAG: hypothetical protein ABIQ93_05570 [Saprospiraceae bacterium]
MTFWLHVVVMGLAWLAPFLLSWEILVPVYATVVLQFAIFDRCLLNKQHGFVETDDRIFYSEVLEKMGFQPDPRSVKTVVRRFLYPVLAALAVVWQWGLGNSPLLF